MSDPVAAPPSGSTDGGGERRGTGPGRRRARNRRHRRNRAKRSLLHIIGWNAEGLRTKVPELQSWLPSVRADVVCIQEAQFSTRTATRIPGFQPPVFTRRERGRTTGAATAKGGDIAIYVRGGIPFSPLTDHLVAPANDSTEVCGVHLLGKTPLTILNVYRPPIRRSQTDQRQDHFDPSALPISGDTIVLGDFNAHHPLWDHGCDVADSVGERLADWLDREDWAPVNTGEPTHSSYRSGGSSAPDAAFCSRALAQRTTWSVGPDLGSDHLPMLLSTRTNPSRERAVRKPRWAFQKANWEAFQAECEEALSVTPPPCHRPDADHQAHRSGVNRQPQARAPRSEGGPQAMGPGPRAAAGSGRAPRGAPAAARRGSYLQSTLGGREAAGEGS